MKPQYATLLVCLISAYSFVATAKPTPLKGAVNSPAPGVICDKKAGFCSDDYGIAAGVTKMYLGDKAEAKLIEIINSAGPGNFDTTTFTLTNGVHCDTNAKKCTTSKFEDKIDAAHTKALFGK